MLKLQFATRRLGLIGSQDLLSVPLELQNIYDCNTFQEYIAIYI